MGKRLSELDETLSQFIKDQQLFFVATAGKEGRVNVSPKGMDSLRVVGPQKVVWLNCTGSGNETAAHLLESNRMTLMFCAFNGKPMILRLYGKAVTLHPRDSQWAEYFHLFPDLPGARQIFILEIDLVLTSCGFSVPIFEFKEERTTLFDWAKKIGPEGVEKYWQENNLESIDGKPTHLMGE